MRHPACKSWQGEEHREILCGEAHCLVDRSTVKINVRVKLAGYEVLICQSNAFQLNRDVNERFSSRDLENFISKLLNNGGPGVEVLVNTMAKAHQYALFSLDLFDEIWNMINMAYFFEHFQNCLICTTVAWTIECSDGATEGSVNVS